MKKIILIVISIVVALAAIAGGLWWYFMGKPLYEPGMVRAENNLRAPLAPPAQAGDTSFWAVEPDIQLHHFSAGQGKAVLVVHGGPGSPYSQPWAGLAPLTGSYQFHYYDQRGCGRSTRPIDTFASGNYYENMMTLDKTLGLGAQLADIERIRRILGEDKLILVGHSFGGFLAALYAAEFPEHVEALILIAPADLLVMPQADGGLFEAVRKRLPEAMQADYAAYLNDYLDFQNLFARSEAELVDVNQGFAKYYGVAMGGNSSSISEIPQQGKAGGWMVPALYMSMGTRHDYRAALKQVSAPVLIIHGADDLQPEAASQAYADAFPNARFQVIPHATHFPFEEQPGEFAAIVGKFLSELK
jgi:proline iminopeptidase